MIDFEVLESFQSQTDTTLLEKAATLVLDQYLKPTDADLTIVITDDEALRNLNQQYRGLDTPTDVLSFPADFRDPENDRPYLGDVVISLPQAERQAVEVGHGLEAELQLLVVHGVLHLLGFDHLATEDKAQMWAAQKEILIQLELENLKIFGES